MKEATIQQARSKPCRHCLYTKNHLGTKERAEEQKAALASGIIDVFFCHEHSDRVLCNGFCRKYPERVPANATKSSQNGDLKAKYAHMTRQQLSDSGNQYVGYGEISA